MWNFTIPASTFGVLRCKGLPHGIPLPQWNSWRDGKFSAWDAQLARLYADGMETLWSSRSEKAVFMGGLRMGTHWWEDGQLKSIKTNTANWHEFSRGKLWKLGLEHPDLFHVVISPEQPSNPDRRAILDAMRWTQEPAMSMHEQSQIYKYVIYLEGNCGWADRLRYLLAYGFLIFMQDGICNEWFLPLLKPWVHYIPVRYDLENLVEHLRWARQHEDEAREIGINAAAFAQEYLNRGTWQVYFEAVMQRYAGMMRYKPAIRENAKKFRRSTICKARTDNKCHIDPAFT